MDIALFCIGLIQNQAKRKVHLFQMQRHAVEVAFRERSQQPVAKSVALTPAHVRRFGQGEHIREVWSRLRAPLTRKFARSIRRRVRCVLAKYAAVRASDR